MVVVVFLFRFGAVVAVFVLFLFGFSFSLTLCVCACVSVIIKYKIIIHIQMCIHVVDHKQLARCVVFVVVVAGYCFAVAETLTSHCRYSVSCCLSVFVAVVVIGMCCAMRMCVWISCMFVCNIHTCICMRLAAQHTKINALPFTQLQPHVRSIAGWLAHSLAYSIEFNVNERVSFSR